MSKLVYTRACLVWNQNQIIEKHKREHEHETQTNKEQDIKSFPFSNGIHLIGQLIVVEKQWTSTNRARKLANIEYNELQTLQTR